MALEDAVQLVEHWWNTRPRQVHARIVRPLQLSNPTDLVYIDQIEESASPLRSSSGALWCHSRGMIQLSCRPQPRHQAHSVLKPRPPPVFRHIQTIWKLRSLSHIQASGCWAWVMSARFMFWMVIPPNFMSYQRGLWIAQLTLGLYRDMFYGRNRLPHSKGRSDWEQLTGCGFVEDGFLVVLSFS